MKCIYCKNNISFCGNMINLSYHLEQKHSEQVSECCSIKQGNTKAAAASCDEDQPVIMECFACKTSYQHRSKWYETFENALVEFIYKDFQPVSIIESIGFLN